LNERSGRNFSKIMQQYIEFPSPPVLEKKFANVKGKTKAVAVRWATDVEGFQMPVEINTGKKGIKRIDVGNSWTSIPVKKLESTESIVNTLKYYVLEKEVTE